MNALLAEFDLIRDGTALGLACFGLLFGVSFLVAVADKGKRVNQSTLQFVLAHLIGVPALTYMTLWCYAHPERLDALPDPTGYDMRPWWPFFAVGDVILLVWFARNERRLRWHRKAMRLVGLTERLRAEGRDGEADDAFAEAVWILERKCSQP